MGRIPSSSDRAGLRRLAVGGVAVTSAYRQIRLHLESTLGIEAALLFAEPVERGNGIDWYSDAAGEAQRLVEIDAPSRASHAERLSAVVAAVTENARALLGDRDGYRKHLGQLLDLALQIPDERHVWIVDGQPVLTFWGHTRELGEPAESPLNKLVAAERLRARPETDEPSDGSRSGEDGAEEEAAAAAKGGSAEPYAEETSGSGTARGAAGRTVFLEAKPAAWQLVLLWLLFAALLLSIGMLLLRSCAITLPAFLGMPAVNFCAPSPIATLSTETERLLSERERLMAEIDRRRRVCRPSPVTQAEPEAEPVPTPVESLAGCWEGDAGSIVLMATAPPGGEQTPGGAPAQAPAQTQVTPRYCIDATGNGGEFRFSGDGGYLCSTPMTVTRTETGLVLNHSNVTCSDNSEMRAAKWICKNEAAGTSLCVGVDLLPDGSEEPEEKWIKDLRFHRVEGSTP